MIRPAAFLSLLVSTPCLLALGCASNPTTLAATNSVAEVGPADSHVSETAEPLGPADAQALADIQALEDGLEADDLGAPPPDALPPAAAPTHSYADWMSALLADTGGQAPASGDIATHDITLLDITLPRSHDTGTYLFSSCTFGASECNTRTQDLPMLAQLEAGIRVFDVRPMQVNGQYVSYHTTDCGGLGCQGDTIESILTQTRAFVEAHAELVILQLSHYCESSANDSALAALVADTLQERLYREPVDASTDLLQRPLAAFIPIAEALFGDTAPSGGHGTVLVLWSGLPDTPTNRALGRFSDGALPISGKWSNKQTLEALIDDQIGRFLAFTGFGEALFELGWTMTMDAQMAAECLLDDPRTLESMAAETNGALASELQALVASGDIAPGSIPNIISVDYADEAVTAQCLALTALNLGLSEPRQHSH